MNSLAASKACLSSENLNYPSARMRSEGYSTWSVCLCVCVCVCVCLCVCVSVTQHLTFYVIIRATSDTNLLSGG